MANPDDALETFTGGRFHPFDPDPSDVHIADIAGGLAHTCRFGGHCRSFYSVAQHSLFVASELEDQGPRLELYGLLHDAAEAYLGDLPRPVKREFDAFEAAEARILDTVWSALDVESPSEAEWETVMAADDRLLAYEADALLENAAWAADPPDLSYALGSTDIQSVRRRYRRRAKQLLESVGAAPELDA